MLRKHINADAFSVDVKSRTPESGPCSCPQPGCQSSDGSGAYRKGCVVYEEYGGHSGDYVTSNPCKCCDGKGYLANGERAYERYCVSYGVRDLKTGYPDPHPMSRQVYDSPRVLEAIKSKAVRSNSLQDTSKANGDCFIATAVYGSYESPEVCALRRFRDERLKATTLGRAIIRSYYAVSPSIATRLQRHPRASSVVRKALDAMVRRVG